MQSWSPAPDGGWGFIWLQRMLGQGSARHRPLSYLAGWHGPAPKPGCSLRESRPVSRHPGGSRSRPDRVGPDGAASLRAVIHNASSFAATVADRADALDQLDLFYAVHMRVPFALNHSLADLLTETSEPRADIVHITDILCRQSQPQVQLLLRHQGRSPEPDPLLRQATGPEGGGQRRPAWTDPLQGMAQFPGPRARAQANAPGRGGRGGGDRPSRGGDPGQQLSDPCHYRRRWRLRRRA